MTPLNKYEIFILDNRELEELKKYIHYWKKFADLTEGKLQSILAVKELYSKNKKLRKAVRKEFIYAVETHQPQKAREKQNKLNTKRKELERSIKKQEKKFNILDRINISAIQKNPKSRVNSPSFLTALAAEEAFKCFMKGLNYDKNNL